MQIKSEKWLFRQMPFQILTRKRQLQWTRTNETRKVIARVSWHLTHSNCNNTRNMMKSHTNCFFPSDDWLRKSGSETIKKNVRTGHNFRVLWFHLPKRRNYEQTKNNYFKLSNSYLLLKLFEDKLKDFMKAKQNDWFVVINFDFFLPKRKETLNWKCAQINYL